MTLTNDVVLPPTQAAKDLSEEALQELRERLEVITDTLERMRAKMRDFQNNRGINPLYLVFGMLQWYETDTSEEMISSPLLLVPVELRVKSRSDTFEIARTPDREIVINPTLRAKLERDFGIVLPVWHDDMARKDAETDPFERFEHSVATSLQDYSFTTKWQIEQQAYLGLFTFQRQALYEDLTIHADLVRTHPIIRAICNEIRAPFSSRAAIPSDRLDDDVPLEETWQILDADSSQQEAIVAAKGGQSFVLQGPPGTGKSQTIANIIAESLAAGKRVLFVSEKMAAVEVVFKRLEDAGLGSFCLNLHQRQITKSAKDLTIAALKYAFNSSAGDWRREQQADQHHAESLAQLQQRRQTLNHYVRALHEQRSLLDWTAFEVYGRLMTWREVPDVRQSIRDVKAMTKTRWHAIEDLLNRLNTYQPLMRTAHRHPWRETLLADVTPAIESSIRAIFDDILQRTQALHDEAMALRQRMLPGEDPIALKHVAALMELANLTKMALLPLPEWLVAENAPALQTHATEAQVHGQTHAVTREAILVHYLPEVLADEFASASTTLHAAEAYCAPMAPRGLSIFLTDVPRWRQHMQTSQQTLQVLAETAVALAQSVNLAPPRTLDEYDALIELGTLLGTIPKIPEEWLDPAFQRSLRTQLRAIEARYRRCAEIRFSVARVFDETIFSADLSTMHQRFTTDYASILRMLRPAWYRDQAQLRTHLRDGMQLPPYAELTTLLAVLQEMHEEERRLVNEAHQHQDMLGPLFDGQATRWEDLHNAMAWVQQLTTVMQHTSWTITPVIRQMVTSPRKRQAETVAILHQQAHGALLDWNALESVWKSLLNLPALAEVAALEDLVPTDLAARIASLAEVLEPLWMLQAQLTGHLREKTSLSWEALCLSVTQLAAYAAEERWFASEAKPLREHFGRYCTGPASDWAAILATLSRCAEIVATFGGETPPERFLQFTTASDEAGRDRSPGCRPPM